MPIKLLLNYMDIQWIFNSMVKKTKNKTKKKTKKGGKKGLKWLYILDDPKHVYNDLFGIHKY